MKNHKKMIEALLKGKLLGNDQHETLYLDENDILVLDSNKQDDNYPFQRVFHHSTLKFWHILNDEEIIENVRTQKIVD